MLRSGIFKCPKNAFILGLNGAKSDKIKIIRKQYDAFLEEDKKRKERNDFILERLDKMRFCDSLVPYRSKVHFVNESIQNRSHARFEKPVKEQEISQIKTSSGPRGFNESLLLKEISKKYILIPKLRQIDDNEFVEATPAIKPTSFDDNNWKSKYDILDQLKQNEKEELEPTNQRGNNIHSFESELENRSSPLEGLPTHLKYEEPEKDIQHDEHKMVKEQNYILANKTSPTKEVTVDFSPNAHQNFELNDSGQPMINELFSKEAESLNISTKKDANEPSIAIVSQCDKDATQNSIPEEIVPQPHLVKNDFIGYESSNTIRANAEQKIQLRQSSQVYESQVPNEYNTRVNTETENDINANENYQYENDANKVEEQTCNVEIIGSNNDEQNLDYHEPLTYEQQNSNEYNSTNYVGDDATYATENYQYEIQGQEYSNVPDHLHVNQTPYSTENQEYYNPPQYDENVNTVESVHATNENINEQSYPSQIGGNEEIGHENYESGPGIVMENVISSLEVTDDIAQETQEDMDDENPDCEVFDYDAINQHGNLELNEAIRDFEAEAELYNSNENLEVERVDPFASVLESNEGINQQNTFQPEEFNALYEGEQLGEDPLDMHDYDATLQQYDQNYENQFAGDILEENTNAQNVETVPNLDQVQVSQVEYDYDNVSEIEKNLDAEQGYNIDQDMDLNVVPMKEMDHTRNVNVNAAGDSEPIKEK